MLGEISKRNDDLEEAIKYYLKGISSDPIGYYDNYTDLAEICEILDLPSLSLIIQRISQILSQINEGILEEGNEMILAPEEWDDLQFEFG